MKQSTKRLLSMMICFVMIIAMLPVGAFAADNTTVYCQTPGNWTVCKAYWWGSAGSNPGWPGEEMTKTEDGIWTYDVPSDAKGLIFNNGGGSQSADLTVPTDDKVMFVYTDKYWTTYGKVEVDETEKYYVAGVAGLCGVAWSPDAAENKMADDDKDGIYTITYKNVAAGKYQFKVTKGNWDECWPNDNYSIDLAAESNVTISFNTADSSIAVDVVPLGEPVVTEPVVANYYVAGSFNGWTNPDAAYQMAAQADGTYALTFALTAGDYEFKVTAGNWDECWGGDGPGGNYAFSAVADGDLTVTFNPADFSIAISGSCLGGDTPTEPTEPSVPSDVVYIVAGSESLCGTGWLPDDVNNKMSDEDGDGIYTITYTDVAAGSYEFKVTNGSWAQSWPGDNYVLNVPETTDVTISFNPADSTIGVSFGGETGPVYILAGQDSLCGSNWDPSDANNKLTDADGDGIYTITYTDLAAADYMFKVTNGTWEQCWGGDGADGNYVFRLWAKSNVTISFNPENGIITLDIEELEAPIEPPIPDVPSVTYYVAGDMNGWTNPDAAYTMNDQGDGTYTLTFSVTAGDYGLKVTDGTWTNCWPGDNYNFKAYTDGEVTVTFNTGDYSVSVTGECLNEPAPEPMTITSMHVAGSEGLCGVHWDPTFNKMDVAMGVYSITFTDVAAGTYEFKFVANAAWGMEWASGVEMPSGETQPAWFMPMGNSSVVVAEDGSTVTLTFDMTTMDIITGEDATCSALVEAPVVPEEPTAAFQVGDQIIIYALETDVALSTTQNKNNRGQAAIIKNEGTISFGEDVQVITLVEGTVAGTFGFQVGEGQYLYAASSSSNHLKTTDTLDDNGSWSIVIDATTGEATITASGANTRNLLRYNKASSIFSCYGSNQQAVAVYKITGEEPEPPVVKDLELELGDNTLILDAGDRDGDTWTFEVTEAGTLTINPVSMMADNGMGQLEAVPAEYVSMVLAKQFALQINGVAVFEYPAELTVVEGDTIELFFCSNMAAPAELTLNLTLTPPVVEEPETQTATLVTDVNSLKAGDQIIIVAQDYDKAMSAELKNNNRDAIDITKDGNTVAFTDAVQVITLVEGTVAGTFGFQVGEGQYLYAASSKSNYLKLTETLDDNGSFAITVDENGELSVVASGSNTRNILRYNSGSNLFSCYGSGQAAICIYTLGGTTEEPDSNELVLGDNALTLDAGDWDGNTWTFVATEDGALKLDVTALVTEDMGVMQEVPSEYLPMVFGRQFSVFVNDSFFDIFNQTWPVSAGDVVSIRISSNMGNATELTLNLSIGEAEIVVPGGPGTMENPIVIESMPFELTVEGSHDIYYTYVAEKDGTLVFTAEEGNLVSLANFEKVGNKYYVNVTAGEEISINPWGEVSGTYTMAYYVAEEVSLKCESITVSFKEEFLMNIYFNGTNLDAAVEMGMLTYSSKVDNFSVFNAENVYFAEYNEANSMYRVTTNGISAKNMGDTVWMVLYAKLADGSYYYTDMAGYSPASYAYALLKEGNPTTQRLMIAMLNYGAAAQTYFGYNTDNLVNKDVTDVQQTMISGYNSDMVSKADAVPAEKQGAFAGNGGFADLAVTVSFKGTFVINYYGKATAAIADTVTLYYWDEATYQSNEVLTAENASGSVDMILNDNGQYVGSLSGFVARKLNTPVYVAMVYSDGTTTQSSGVLPYSVGQYCSSFAGTQDVFAPMAEATAIYGFYAKQYFG